jgi:hypothetical protein
VTHRHRALAVVLVVLLVAGSAVTALTALSAVTSSDGDPADLIVSWGGGEGRPSCAYDAAAGTVEALLVIRGEAPPGDSLSVTVTAYADENTSQRVGAVRQVVPVSGPVDGSLTVTVPVQQAPHVGEDDEAACRLDVEGAGAAVG